MIVASVGQPRKYASYPSTITHPQLAREADQFSQSHCCPFATPDIATQEVDCVCANQWGDANKHLDKEPQISCSSLALPPL